MPSQLLPDSYFQDSLENVRLRCDQPTAVQNDLLLQHGLYNIMWLHARVHHRVDFCRDHRLVENCFFVTDDSNCQLKQTVYFSLTALNI